MTGAQWLACKNPRRMLRFLGEQASLRKLRLFACSCCRCVWPLLTDAQSRVAVEVAERYADDLATDRERDAARTATIDLDWQITREEGQGDTAREMANCAAMSSADDDAAFLPRAGDDEDYRAAEDSSHCAAQATVYGRLNKLPEKRARSDELAAQARLVREIFGNPFRPVIFAPSWRTDTVLALARQMYEGRDFSTMPILADALQDAGCDNTDILDHCRGAGPHVRGCWVLDLVLEKA